MTAGATPRPRPTAIRAAALFDGLSTSMLTDQLVIVDGATIRAVDQGTEPPADADLIDLGGATLVPGLVDTHAHLAFDASGDPVAGLAGRDDGEAVAAMVAAGRAALLG